MADGITLPPPQRTIADDARPSSQMGNLTGAGSAPIEWRDIVRGSGNPNVYVQVQEETDGTISAVGDDGSVTIGMPAVHTHRDEDQGFNENLAGKLNSGSIAEEVIQGVEADILSRSDWTAQYSKALDLLGIKIEEIPKGASGNREYSKASEPLMIEAMVNYHAQAEAEMLPASGPTKVTTLGKQDDDTEERAKDFQDTMNYFFTEVAKEYYQDTSRMLMHQAFCGQGFKKVRRCPLRRRPVSESVLAPDLIVSEEATDLDNARRVTHQTQMTKGEFRRMQIVGAYVDIDIGQPTGNYSEGNIAQRKIKQTEGLVVQSGRPEDILYNIWETDVELDPGFFGINFKYERASPDLPLPYKVTVESTTRQVVGIYRNWKDGDDLYRKRNMYVKFGMIPGMGFMDWGFMQLLGNQTKNLRTMLRLLIAAGMFSNFPGGFKGAQARTSTNDISPGPGEWIDINAPMGPNFDISKLFMPMPYKEPSQVFIQLRELIKSDAKRLGASTQIDVGEGRANIPVGTMLAQIEQQIQVMSGVQKRNHVSQKNEIRKIRDLFVEYPNDLPILVRDRPISNSVMNPRTWEQYQDFIDLNLLPASDPNVPSQAHRIMLANVLIMMAQQFPTIFDTHEVARTAVRAIGADPERYVIRPENTQEPPPDPKLVAAQAAIAQKNEAAQLNAQIAGEKVQVEREKIAANLAMASGEQQTKRNVESTKLAATSIAPGAGT